MMTSIALWLIGATLTQPATADSAWLKAVPQDADIVIRVRGVTPARDDLLAMLKAMSPNAANQIEPLLGAQVAQLGQQFGDRLMTTPFLALLRAVEDEKIAGPPFAVLVPSDDYNGTLKTLVNGRDPKAQPEAGGYDAFDGPDGTRWFAVKGDGFVAFGPDKTLVAGVASPGKSSLDSALTPVLRDRFFRGDLGVYVNLAALAQRYREQINQAKQALFGALDQAGPQFGNAGMMESAKKIYGALFDSANDVESLVLSVDFAEVGLNLSGALSAKPGTELARRVTDSEPGTAADLSRLPADLAYYISMSLSPRTMTRLQSMGLQMISPAAGKPSPELEKALELQRQAGRMESTGGMAIAGGMAGLTVITAENPGKFFEATLAGLKATKDLTSGVNYIKDVVVTPDAETYRNIKFTRSVTTIDLDKLAASQPGNPAATETLKSMFGGNALTSWIGSDDKHTYQVIARDWEAAKSKLDSYFQGTNALGEVAGYKMVRAQLSEKSSLLALVSVQGLVRQIAAQFAAMAQNPNLKVPTDMPKAPVFLGLSITPMSPASYDFRVIVPSTAGPVFEHGLVPVFQGLRGQINQ